MTEEAQLAKLYACFHQLSAAHKQEMLEKMEEIVSAESEEISTDDREKRIKEKPGRRGHSA